MKIVAFKEEPYSRADRLTSDLCREIDHLEAKLADMTAERDDYRNKYCDAINNHIAESDRTTRTILELSFKGMLRELEEAKTK